MDLPLLSAVFAAFSITMYVLLDGFDLGVGALLLLQPDEASRNHMVDSLTPTWDGNETWLLMTGVTLLAGFPLARPAQRRGRNDGRREQLLETMSDCLLDLPVRVARRAELGSSLRLVHPRIRQSLTRELDLLARRQIPERKTPPGGPADHEQRPWRRHGHHG